jgi:putative ABC transport system substrate-binding protein
MGLRLEVSEVRTLDDIAEAFAAMSRNGVRAYLGIGGPIVFEHRQKVAALALAHRIPGVHSVRELVEAGALANYGPNQDEMMRRAARYVDKILKGAKPAELAVEAPERYELVINLKTAQALGLTIPQSVLLRADEVIR